MEKVMFAVDVVALVVMAIAALFVLMDAGKRPLGQTLVSLLLYACIVVAVLGCSTTPRETPARESSQERCVDLVVVSCERVGACYGPDFEKECLGTTSGCANVVGISQVEADICRHAIERAPCDRLVPDACLGIAEPKDAEGSPQPTTRTL